METIRLKTDLSCERCKDTLGPILDAEKSIESWDVDFDSPEKTPTVKGQSVGEAAVARLVEKAGYHVLGPGVLPV